MTIRDSAATRRRILEAATAEFASYGLAGARVDRIAAAAQANKNLIYTYFGNKDQLFGAVFNEYISTYLDSTPFDVNNLPAYAGHLFDFILAHPHVVRLVRWYSLERPGGIMPLLVAKDGTDHKLVDIAAAQQAGIISSSMPADHLYAFITVLATTWSDGNLLTNHIGDTAEEQRKRRASVIDAVRRLVEPPRH